MNELDKVTTVSEYARMAGAHVRVVQRWAVDGTITARKYGQGRNAAWIILLDEKARRKIKGGKVDA